MKVLDGGKYAVHYFISIKYQLKYCCRLLLFSINFNRDYF
jgi:hypothetical protein